MRNTSPSLSGPGSKSLLASPFVQVAVGLVIVAAMASWLDVMGRPLLCECGTVALWDGDPHSPGASQQFADWYSALHVMFGLGLFVFLDRMRPRWPTSWKLLAALASSAVWEIAENTPVIIAMFGQAEGAPAYEGDSILNALGDTVFVVIGFFAARTVPLGATIAIALVLEAAIAFAISDGFVLGTLRLVGIPV
ncbi:DUF2585 family protein [Aureimonas sp. AU12]|uniref:DUF2585 family protein n=1 Tax=Aureimonas sp. AU12 TaxID=1638161 RepID=UPI000AB1278E|nr:DUF2585 family protein [Aureimonas sp. AU12]